MTPIIAITNTPLLLRNVATIENAMKAHSHVLLVTAFPLLPIRSVIKRESIMILIENAGSFHMAMLYEAI